MINNESSVKEGSRTKVWTAIKQLNYHPNLSARHLRGAPSSFALIYDNPNSNYIIEMQQGVLDQCREKRFELVIHPCNSAASGIGEELMRMVSRSGVGGLVLTPPLSEMPQVITILNEENIKHVRIVSGSAPPDDLSTCVYVDDRAAARRITEHLIEYGHRSISFFGGDPAHASSGKRLEGYKEALRANGISIDDNLILPGVYSFESGADRARELMGRCFAVEIILTSPKEISFGGWQLYFSQLFPLHQVESDEFVVETINGDLKRIIPNDNYAGFRSGESKTLTLYLAGTHGNEFEAMPNYYVAADGLSAKTVSSTVPTTDPATGLEVLPHLTPFTDAERQFRISDAEKIEWATSSVLYAVNRMAKRDQAGTGASIIPTPIAIQVDTDTRQTDLAAGIAVDLQGLDRSQIAAALERLALFGITERDAGLPLIIQPVPKTGSPAGAYTLEIKPNGIRLIATDAAGAFYGLESLASLVNIGDVRIPSMTVTDWRRYAFRGLHIDVSRNFHSKQLVLKLISQMAAYKLNKLHLHLGDDEGWRMQIPGLPELTEIGSRRCHDPSETHCLLPQLGSGPYGKSRVNGFFTVADYQEILEAATAHHIQVIPSFDMPGHSRAAVKSMEARYRKYLEQGNKEEATRYFLTDLDDSSDYNSIQNYTDNTINVCMASAYAIVDKVISEMQRMHAEVGHPLTRYHISADETAGAGKQSSVCNTFFAANDSGIKNPSQLGAYFIERVTAL